MSCERFTTALLGFFFVDTAEKGPFKITPLTRIRAGRHSWLLTCRHSPVYGKRRLEKIRNRKSETKRTTIRLVDFVLYISCLSVFFQTYLLFYIYVQTIFFRDEGLRENKCSEFFEGNQRLMGRSATLVRLKRKIDRPECPDRNENVCGEHRIWGTAPPQALIRRYLTS